MSVSLRRNALILVSTLAVGACSTMPPLAPSLPTPPAWLMQPPFRPRPLPPLLPTTTPDATKQPTRSKDGSASGQP